VSIHRKKSRKIQTIFTWIRQRTSPFDYGVKAGAGRPVHCNTNDDVLMHFQALQAGYWIRRLSKLDNADMADHFAGEKTFYFAADGRCSVFEVLVNLDIDCHHSGSLDGAVAFAEYLKAACFPNLYYEVSTNGNGVHGYIVVVKGDLGDEGLNSALGRLDRWLKHELSRGDWDVENVEVKGQAPVFTWGEHKYELKTYKSGQLAKLPREALARSDELRGTTRITVDDLRRLRSPSATGETPKPVVRKPRSRMDRIAFGVNEEKQVGSISGRHFDSHELAKLKGDYLEIATELLGETRLVATGRKVVTPEDLAIFLMLLRFFTNSMNVDGTLPTARWREMWLALYEAGDVERAWCHHRYAAMRDLLSRKDLLSWEDEAYVIGSEVHGRHVPGTAAKWRASEGLMARLGGAERSSGCKERRRSILYGCSVSNQPSRAPIFFESITVLDHDLQDKAMEEGEKILYGCSSSRSHFLSKARTQRQRAEPAFIVRLRAEIPPSRPQFAGYSWQREGLRLAA